MLRLLKREINLGFFINPFYLYCLTFSLAIFVYSWGWSDIFPPFSGGLILFLILSFLFFIFAGSIFGKMEFKHLDQKIFIPYFHDIMFWLIIFLGIINVLIMGYLPVLDRSHDYRTFGAPVIDPVFNTLSIFFSVFFFQSFLENRKRKFLVYIVIILLIQILLFRRSTIVWIIISTSFLFLIYKRKVTLLIIIISLFCIPLFSYSFGLYGNIRRNLTKSYVINHLGASDVFKKSGLNNTHYITYLYISSPLANLQKNINLGKGVINNGDINDFCFYCLMPESITQRLEKQLNLTRPDCSLISSDLIVGTFLMVSFYFMGWLGMIGMLIFLLVFIFLCFLLIKKWSTFSITTFSLLSTTVSLLVFSNFLNRLDIILMLFIYPVLFHFIATKSGGKVSSE